MKGPSILMLTLFALLAVLASTQDFSITCYDQSSTYSGVATGSRVSDRPTLNTTINNGTLNASFRTAAIKSCTNNQTGSSLIGQLLGHQIALANYDEINGDTPSESDLMWLPGVG